MMWDDFLHMSVQLNYNQNKVEYLRLLIKIKKITSKILIYKFDIFCSKHLLKQRENDKS